MTTTQRNIHSSLETRDSYSQAALEGAALRGDLGPEAQIIALSARYMELRAQGQIEQAAAVKAQAYEIYNASR